MGDIKEWTLMFYFASDNPLAASIVSQLKSIKQAGFHPDANVIAQFDPQTEGTPTHIFDVNSVDKINARNLRIPYRVGVDRDAAIPTLVTDKLWGKTRSRNGGLVTDQIRKSLKAQGLRYQPTDLPATKSGTKDEPSPRKSLQSFLRLCYEKYPARHYVLFILGHGLVVGNDIFLFDEHAADEHSLNLSNLGKLLRAFKRAVEKRRGKFELVSFHSCSMSAMEVAYELQGTANYMLASQGPAFVGSWPYRQILMRLFNDLVIGKKEIKKTFKVVLDGCLENSYDFQLAGFSFDVTLCDLTKIGQVRQPMKKLSGALQKALKNSLARELILLSHWEAQSYWQETYVDLYDFCLRLDAKCKYVEGDTKKAVADFQEAWPKVMALLDPGDENVVIHSRFAGPAYQYSHGLSVFFPWSRPVDDKFWPDGYDSYRFRNTDWRRFLERYFARTMRNPRGSEVGRAKREGPVPVPTLEQNLLEEITSSGLTAAGQLSKSGGSDATGSSSKAGGTDPTGGPKSGGTDPTGDFAGPAIKNFPSYTRDAEPQVNAKARSARAKRR